MKFAALFLIAVFPILSQEYLFVVRPDTVLKKPEITSAPVRTVKFGETLVRLEGSHGKWLRVEDISGLIGWMKKNNTAPITRENRYSVVVREINARLIANAGFFELNDMAEYLLAITRQTEFSGSEYLYLKVKAGQILYKALGKYNDSSPAFRKKHYGFLGKYSAFWKKVKSGGTEFDNGYFWNIAETFPETRAGDFAGYLAVEYTEQKCSSSDVICRLSYLRDNRLKYIRIFPDGSYARRYARDSEKEMKQIRDDIENCPDREKFSRFTAGMEKWLDEFPMRYSGKFGGYLQDIRQECR